MKMFSHSGRSRLSSASEGEAQKHEHANQTDQSDGSGHPSTYPSLQKRGSSRRSVESHCISSEDDGDHDDRESMPKTRERKNSLFGILHLPRLIQTTSSRRKSEISSHSSTHHHPPFLQQSNSSSLSEAPGTVIIQPTASHALAAGGSPYSSRKHSFSTKPPSGFYDEESGLPHEDAYLDRDVRYAADQDDEDDNSINGGRFKTKRSLDDVDPGEMSDDERNTDDELIPNIIKYSGNTDNSNNNSSSEFNGLKELDSDNKTHPAAARVAIDDRKVKKVIGTDTDFESDYGINIYQDPAYLPQSILKRQTTDANRNSVNEDMKYDSKHSGEDEEKEELNRNVSNQQSNHNKSKKKRSARRRRRKSRKYAGSQSKKERTAWEPGIDLRTTNVFLNSPGSIITITDYSKSRYRISHYDLYSEMNSKYNKFLDDDTILSPHDFNEDDYESKNPEYIDYMQYMNKVSDSRYEVEEAIKNKPTWSQVRWINVNGLSWEAISIIGKRYNLHPLSVEDLVDIPQRTKMDLYQQHLFIVMPLMKLLKVKRYQDEADESHFNRVRKNIRSLLIDTSSDEANRGTKNKDLNEKHSSSSLYTPASPPTPSTSTEGLPPPRPKVLTKTIATREQLNREFSRTSTKSMIQPESPHRNEQTASQYKNGDVDITRMQSSVNDRILPRTSTILKLNKNGYDNADEHKLAIEIEKASSNRRLTDLTFITPTSSRYKSRMRTINRMRPLMSKSLAVGVEQVSMYLTSDGTVLSFFEHSAMEIERAILSRLSADYTILRETCNPSILFHSVLDANVDLLYPVVTAYTRILNEKEVEILTAALPDLQHTQELHLMLNELAILKNSILPVSSLITQLKDVSVDPNSLFIDESCKLYLADIGDHLLAFIDEIDSMSSTIENLIDLIFNTLSVETNNSMQQLSLVSVLFLPLTFWAGYFGMNFKSFGNLDYNVSFFWQLAVPFTAVMMILLMKNSVWRLVLRLRQWSLVVTFNFKQFLKANKESDHEDYIKRERRKMKKWRKKFAKSHKHD